MPEIFSMGGIKTNNKNNNIIIMQHFVHLVVRYWHGYLSGVRCKWFAYGPADGTATLSSFAAVKSRMAYFSGASLPRLSWKKDH